MKKSLIAVAGALAGAAMFVAATPAMAHERWDVAVSLGVPVAPVTYVAPPPVYVAPPAPVVVAGPVYYGNDWRYYHGYRGYWHHDEWRHGDWHRDHDRHEWRR
ncbi:MAG: hypothetical protein JO002_04105 [Burkholderiaceae bacterium]|nr:hypothetical protein [Burkholderiaceae bacterium]